MLAVSCLVLPCQPVTKPTLIDESVTHAPDFRAVLIVALEGALAALKGEAVPGNPDEPTAAYIKDADGGLRKRSRGKPRRGEEVVWLTESQARAQGYTEE